jgi:hypothetical protein
MVEEAKGRHEDESHVSKLIHIVNSKYLGSIRTAGAYKLKFLIR